MKHSIIVLLFSCNLLFAEPVSSNSVSPDDNYRLAPDDLLQVRVFREEDMDCTVRISRDGTVTLPLIGIVQLGGKTANEAGATVRDLLDRDYVVHPQVTVTVMEFTRQTFTILGQVQKPGSYKIASQGTFTLLQAVGRGGGYTRIANPGNVTVKRQAGGRETLLKVNAKTMAKESGEKPFLILPGDTITIGESIF
jgi:polysaccharide export outer membrane protein